MIERIKARIQLIRPLLIPLVLYLGFLVISFHWVEAHPHSSWRYPMALLPMLPGIWIAVGVVRAIQKLDEMERQILLEGIAVSFMGTIILTLSLGLLQIAGFTPVNAIYIGFFMLVLWLIAKLGLHRRYE